MTRIAILETGHPPEDLKDAFDDYPARFRALLGEGVPTTRFNVQAGHLPDDPAASLGGRIVDVDPGVRAAAPKGIDVYFDNVSGLSRASEVRFSGLRVGQVSDLEIQAAEIERIRKRLDDILAEHTGQPADKIRKDTDRDNILTADQAKEYGIVDTVFPYRKASAK